MASAKKIKKKIKKKNDVTEAKKPLGNFQIASESDDSNEDLDAVALARAKAKSRGGKAPTSGSAQSRNKTQIITVARGGFLSVAATHQGEQTIDGKQDNQQVDETKAGRKAKDVREVSVEHACAFEDAVEDSVYFSEMAPVVLRSLARHNIHV